MQPDWEGNQRDGAGGAQPTGGAELPRPPGFVWSLGPGTVSTRGEGSAAGDRSRHPPPSSREMPGGALPSAATTKPG